MKTGKEREEDMKGEDESGKVRKKGEGGREGKKESERNWGRRGGGRE